MHEGEVFRSKLSLWPYEANDEESYKKLKSKIFLDFFYVVDVTNIKRSENNSDVLEIDLLMLVVKVFQNRPFFLFQHRDLNIPVEIKIKEIKKHKNVINKFILWEIDKNKKSFSLYWILIITSVFFISLLLILYRKNKNKNKDNNKEIDKNESKVLDLLKSSSRKNYEELYKYREALKKMYPESGDSIKKFLSAMELDQYKEEWEKGEEIKISRLIDNIREKK